MKKLAALLLVFGLLFFVQGCKKEQALLTEEGSGSIIEPLEAKFSYSVPDPNNIFENQEIRFTNLSKGYKTLVWEFGNQTKSSNISPTKIYPVHGYYTVKLIVWDDAGNRSEFEQDISILCNFSGGTHP